LAVVMVLAAATAAAAVDQTVNVNVQPEDALGIQVQEYIDLGVEVGQSSGWHEFDMQILNTTSSGWKVEATSTDLFGYTEDCDEHGENCEVTLTGNDIPATALELAGGDQDDWGDPGAITGFTGSLHNTTALKILEGTAVPQGWFGINDQRTALRVSTPDNDSLVGQVNGTIAYTIMAP